MARHNELGKWGEDMAAGKLIADGCAIVERNWRLGHYEIDIIATKDDVLIVAEVKTRSNADEDPLEAVDRRKISHMVRAAEAFCNGCGWRGNLRFDLLTVCGTPEDYTLEHVPDAFYPPLKTYR